MTNHKEYIKSLHPFEVETLREALSFYDGVLKDCIKDPTETDTEYIDFMKTERKVLKDMLSAIKVAKWSEHGADVLNKKQKS
jgi:hypothetical protein